MGVVGAVVWFAWQSVGPHPCPPARPGGFSAGRVPGGEAGIAQQPPPPTQPAIPGGASSPAVEEAQRRAAWPWLDAIDTQIEHLTPTAQGSCR